MSTLDDIRKKFLKDPTADEGEDIKLLACPYCYVACLSERTILAHKMAFVLCPNCGKRCLVSGSGGSKPLRIYRENQGWADEMTRIGVDIGSGDDMAVAMLTRGVMDVQTIDAEKIKGHIADLAKLMPDDRVTLTAPRDSELFKRMSETLRKETLETFRMPASAMGIPVRVSDSAAITGLKADAAFVDEMVMPKLGNTDLFRTEILAKPADVKPAPECRCKTSSALDCPIHGPSDYPW